MNEHKELNQTVSVRPRRMRLRLRAAAGLAILAGTCGAAFATTPAHASIAYGGGLGTTVISCNGYGSVYMQVDVSPPMQWRSYRTYVRNVATGVGNWNQWTNLTPGTNARVGASLPHGTYQFYVQYAWWNGSSWLTPSGEWITGYLYTGGYSWQLNQSYCFT